jgi:hypothetical protein
MLVSDVEAQCIKQTTNDSTDELLQKKRDPPFHRQRMRAAKAQQPFALKSNQKPAESHRIGNQALQRSSDFAGQVTRRPWRPPSAAAWWPRPISRTPMLTRSFRPLFRSRSMAHTPFRQPCSGLRRHKTAHAPDRRSRHHIDSGSLSIRAPTGNTPPLRLERGPSGSALRVQLAVAESAPSWPRPPGPAAAGGVWP